MFSKNKVKVISKILKNREIMILDNYFILKDNKKIKSKYSNFKNNDFYKKLINDWPKNVCTSAISIKKELLLKFFSEIKIKKYKFLAIDILLAIYCNNKKKIIKFNRYFTSKVELSDSVDKDYTGFNNKLYWQRRFEQHKYNFFINNKRYFNLDILITYVMTLLLRI